MLRHRYANETVRFDVRNGPDDGAVRWRQRKQRDCVERRAAAGSAHLSGRERLPTAATFQNRARARAAGTLLAWVLLAAAFLAAPPLVSTAQAQTEIWPATLNPRELPTGQVNHVPDASYVVVGCDSRFPSVTCGATRTLSDNKFHIRYELLYLLRDHARTPHPAARAVVSPGIASYRRDRLTLHVADRSYAFRDAQVGDSGRGRETSLAWNHTEISWTNSSVRTLRIGDKHCYESRSVRILTQINTRAIAHYQSQSYLHV